MCGIAGFSIRTDDAQVLMEHMLGRLRHRGPDDHGHFVDDRFAIGNVLLSIVDIGHGRQPFVLPHGGETYVTVFNGEIYNYVRLREELQQIGMKFHTNCDTEVVAAAYAAWGSKAVERFDGQWSCAIWCAKSGKLFSSRDPFGIKPFYYWTKGDAIAFASEPKALFQLPWIACQPNPQAIYNYFLHGFAFAAGYAGNSQSFYADINQLPPGHNLEWTKEKGPLIRPWFQLTPGEPFKAAERADVIDHIHRTVRESVHACLMGDAPVGFALSGGLDSSIITTVAAEEFKRCGMPPPLAVSITYDGQKENEDACHAGLLAQHLDQTNPIHIAYSHISVNAYLDDLDLMLQHFDEPQWEVKQLAMFNNYKVLKRLGAKVVLTGEGADELFFGYYHNFPGFLHPQIDDMETLRRLWRQRIPVTKALLAGVETAHLDEMMNESLKNYYLPYCVEDFEPARRMQCWYLHTFLHWLLLDNDRCSMAHSLEGRFPFLNRSVLDLAMRIPPAWQVGDDYGAEKMLLREAFKNNLPEAIWKQRKKAPLPSPLNLSFHHKIGHALESAIRTAPTEIWSVLDRNYVAALSRNFENKLTCLQQQGATESGGTELTRYLRLQEPWELRTPHAFALLTLLRWWTINFK